MAISGKDYTIDVRKLLRMSVSDRTSMIRNSTFREEILNALTPTELAKIFPQDFKRGAFTPAGGGGGGSAASTLSSFLSGGSSAEGGGAQTAVPVSTSRPLAPGIPQSISTSNLSPEKAPWFKRYMNLDSKSKSTTPLPSAPRSPSNGNPLSNQRQRASTQLNQDMKIHMYALTMAEVGTSNPAAQRALMETIYNRYHAQKKASLSSTMQANYYEPLRTGTRGYQNYIKFRSQLMNNPELFKQMDQRHNEVLAGSNDSNYSTQNGSAHVAASARRTQTIGAELGGETFSRKDNPAYAKLHGAGTVKNEGDWYKSTMAEMQAFESGQSLAKATDVIEQQASQTGAIYPETDAQGKPTLGPSESAGGPRVTPSPLSPESYGVGKVGGQVKYTPQQLAQRASSVNGNIGFKGFNDAQLESLSIPAGSGGWGKGSVPLGTFQISRQQLGSRIAGYYQKHGVPTSGAYGTVYNVGLPGSPTSTGIDPRTGTSRIGIQLHANHSNDINKLYSEGCITPTREQWQQLQPAIERAFEISGSSNLVLQIDQDANGRYNFSVMPPSAGGMVSTNAISVNEAVKNFQKTGNIASEKVELNPDLQNKIKDLDPALQKEIAAMTPEDRNDLYKRMNDDFAKGVNPVDNINQMYKEQPAAAVQTITNAPPGQAPKEQVTPEMEANQTIQKAAEGKIPPASKAVDEALKLKGLNEFRDRDQIKAFLDKSRRTTLDPSQLPWCSSFVNAAMEGSGIKGTGDAHARSWLNWGEGVRDPRDVKKGDVVATMKHVAIATGPAFQDKSGNWIVPTVGGNQSLRGERGIEWVSETNRAFGGVSVRRARPEDYYDQQQVQAVQTAPGSPEPTLLGPNVSAGGPQQQTQQMPTALPVREPEQGAAAPMFDINADPLTGFDRGRVPLNAFDSLSQEEKQALRVQFATDPSKAQNFVDQYNKQTTFNVPLIGAQQITATPDQIAQGIRGSDEYKQHFSLSEDERQSIITDSVNKINQQQAKATATPVDQGSSAPPQQAPTTASNPPNESKMKYGGERYLNKDSIKVTPKEAMTPGAIQMDGNKLVVNRPEIADQKVRVGDLEARRDVKAEGIGRKANEPDISSENFAKMSTQSVNQNPINPYMFSLQEDRGGSNQSGSQVKYRKQTALNSDSEGRFLGFGSTRYNS